MEPQLFDEIVRALLQAPYIVAFGWFVLRLAQIQDKTMNRFLDILLDLCDEDEKPGN